MVTQPTKQPYFYFPIHPTMATQPVKQPYFYFPIHPIMVTQPVKQPYFYFPIHPTMVTQPVKQPYFCFPGNYPFSLITGFPWKTFKTWNFVVFLSRNFISKPRKKLKFANFMFQASLFKMIYFFVISTLSTQTLIRSQIDLEFHCFYLENTWNFVSQEKWEHYICFNTFQDFYNKTLYESTWNLAQKIWNLRPKTLRKPGIWNLEKSGNPVNYYV